MTSTGKETLFKLVTFLCSSSFLSILSFVFVSSVLLLLLFLLFPSLPFLSSCFLCLDSHSSSISPSITESERREKQEELTKIHNTFVLLDWARATDLELEAVLTKAREKRTANLSSSSSSTSSSPSYSSPSWRMHTLFSVVKQDTQQVTWNMKQKYSKRTKGEEAREEEREGVRIAWVNFANAHNLCGTYNVDYGGSQEEEVATNCTAFATLQQVRYILFFSFPPPLLLLRLCLRLPSFCLLV
jgi:hypothetical protein